MLSALQSKKQRNRKEIIKAGIQVFSQKSFSEVSIRDIVKLSTLARGTFYNYFKSKEEVWDAIFKENVAEVHKSARKRRQNSETGEEFIRNLVDYGLEKLSQDPFPILISANPGRFRESYMTNVGNQSIISRGARDMESSGFFDHVSKRNIDKFAFSVIGCAVEIFIQSNVRGDKFSAKDITSFITNVFAKALKNSEEVFEPMLLDPVDFSSVSDVHSTLTKGARSRRKIMTAATELFIKKGLDLTSIDDIVSRAGLSRGTFYNYFKTKEEIWSTYFKNLMQFTIQEGRERRLQSKSLTEYLINVTYVPAVAFSKEPYPALIMKNEMIFRKIFTKRVDDYSIYDMLIDDLVNSGYVDNVEMPVIKKSMYGVIGTALEMLIQSYLNNSKLTPEEISVFVGRTFSYALT